MEYLEYSRLCRLEYHRVDISVRAVVWIFTEGCLCCVNLYDVLEYTCAEVFADPLTVFEKIRVITDV